jgi:general stress protein 26
METTTVSRPALVLAVCSLGLFACAPDRAASPGAPAESSPQAAQVAIPRSELRLATQETDVLTGARALMEADDAVALVTVDASGRPRVRTVRFSLDPAAAGASGFRVWVKTRFTTRKVDQIRANPRVTLYFNDDEKESYASIMGTAVIHTDPDHPGARRHFTEADAKIYWPQFPQDFVMLEIRPEWLEYIGREVSNDDRTWRPQAIVFD